jgi:hypothetical protein
VLNFIGQCSASHWYDIKILSGQCLDVQKYHETIVWDSTEIYDVDIIVYSVTLYTSHHRVPQFQTVNNILLSLVLGLCFH